MLLNPLQNILPSPGLCPGTGISFLASLHSEELFHLPSFPPRNVLIFLTFLSASLPKIRPPFSLSLTSSMVLYFSIYFLHFFLFTFSVIYFWKNVACRECLLMLEKKTGQSTNWINSCLLYCALFRNGQLFVLQPNLLNFSKAWCLDVGSLMAFSVVPGFRGVRPVVPEPKPCLAVLFCIFRLKLAINAVIPPVRQHACCAENITDLEQSQSWPGGVDGGEGNGRRGGERGQSPPAFMKLMPCKILQLYCFLSPVGTVVFHAINIFLQRWQL